MPRKLWMVVVLVAVVGIALVLRKPQEPERSDARGVATPSADLAVALESIRSLEQRVARVEALLASRDASATREPVKSGASTTDAPEPSATSSKEVAALRADLVSVSERLAVTEAGLKDSGLRWVGVLVAPAILMALPKLEPARHAGQEPSAS